MSRPLDEFKVPEDHQEDVWKKPKLTIMPISNGKRVGDPVAHKIWDASVKMALTGEMLSEKVELLDLLKIDKKEYMTIFDQASNATKERASLNFNLASAVVCNALFKSLGPEDQAAFAAVTKEGPKALMLAIKEDADAKGNGITGGDLTELYARLRRPLEECEGDALRYFREFEEINNELTEREIVVSDFEKGTIIKESIAGNKKYETVWLEAAQNAPRTKAEVQKLIAKVKSLYVAHERLDSRKQEQQQAFAHFVKQQQPQHHAQAPSQLSVQETEEPRNCSHISHLSEQLQHCRPGRSGCEEKGGRRS